MSIDWPAHGLKLQARIEGATATVGVIGMGYVGLPLAMAFCEANCSVLAFDLDPEKVDALNAGRSYIKHIDAARLARDGVAHDGPQPGGGAGCSSSPTPTATAWS